MIIYLDGLQCDKDEEKGEIGPCWHLKVVIEDGGVPNHNTHHKWEVSS